LIINLLKSNLNKSYPRSRPEKMQDLTSEINTTALLNELTQAHENTQDVVSYFSIGLSLFIEKQFQEASISFIDAANTFVTKIPHGTSLFEGRLYQWVANCYFLMSKLSQATDYMEKALEVYKDIEGEEAAKYTLQAYEILGDLAYENYDYDNASSNYEEFLDRKKQILDNEYHIDLVEGYIKLGSCLEAVGSEEEAVEMYKNAQKIVQKNKEGYPLAEGMLKYIQGRIAKVEEGIEESIKKLKKAVTFFEDQGIKEKIAEICLYIGSIEDAEPDVQLDCLEKAKSLYQAMYGEKSFKMGAVLEQIGVAYQNDQNWEAAIEHYLQSVECIQLLENEVLLGSLYENLGSCYLQIAKLKEAEEYLIKSLEAYGEDNEEAVFIFNSLGDVFYYQNDKAKSYEYYKKAHDKSKQLSGEPDEDTLENIGRIHAEKAEYEKAHEYIDQAIKKYSQENEDGVNNDNIARLQDLKAEMLIEQGEFDKALDLLTKSKALLTEENIDLVATYSGEALAQARKGEYAKAREAITKAESLLENKADDDRYSEMAGRVRYILGYILIHENKPKEAVTKLEEALEKIEAFGKESPLNFWVTEYESAETYAFLGLAYSKLGEYEAAVTNISMGISKKIKTYGENHPDVARFYYYLGLTHMAKEDYERALKNFESALAIGRKNFNDDQFDVAETLKKIEYVQNQLSRDQ